MEYFYFCKRLAISSTLEGLKECLDLTRDIQYRLHLDADISFAFQTALLEAVINAIQHGNKYNKELEAIITVRINKKQICIEVEDQGEGFDADLIPSPIEKDNICLEKGRGIFFIRQLSSSFNTIGKGNIVNIIINR